MPRFPLALLFPLLLLSSLSASAQSLSDGDRKAIAALEDSLLTTSDSMYNALIPDTRAAYAEQFARQLVRALRYTGSYAYNFPRLREQINIVEPDDKSWRMFNWVIAPTEINRRYYGAIQMPSPTLKLYGLSDISMKTTKGLEDSVFSGGHWMGALYYRVMPVTKNGETVYTMFGANGALTSSNRKVLDAMRLTPEGPVFGHNIFAVGSENFRGQPVMRFILEYSKEVQVGLNWNDEYKVITHDELVSSANDPTKKYTYVPTGEIQGFRWDPQVEQWVHVRDVLPVQILRDGAPPTVENPDGGQ